MWVCFSGAKSRQDHYKMLNNRINHSQNRSQKISI